MPEDIAINGSEAPCLDIRHPVEGIDEVHCMSRCKMANNIIERSGNGIDSKVTLPQVILKRVAFKLRNIDDELFIGFRAFFIFTQGNNDTVSFVVHIDIMTAQFVRQAARERRRITGSDNIPIIARFAE